jgi:prepilin-type N-terminal cleavage/methylation domain-containing protein
MRRQQVGFTLIEIMLVVGIIAIISALATPMFLSYYQGAQVRVAAEEVATFLNQGRQLAITQNRSICVHITTTAMHYHQGTCADDTNWWKGPGTDASGNIPVPEGITLTTNNTDLIFNYLGGSNTATTYTILHTKSNKVLRVVAALSGRVNITP